MKKSLFLFIASLQIAVCCTAQITLNSTDYPSSVFGTERLKKSLYLAVIPALPATANGTWDLSTVGDTTPISYIYRVPSALHQFADSTLRNAIGFDYYGSLQSSILTSGIVDYSVTIPRQANSLALMTGGFTDSMIIVGQNMTFSAPHTRLALPVTMSTSWSSTYKADFLFQLSVLVFGYNHAPCIARRYTTEKDSVVGWGTMRVKTLSGGVSSPFNVLQVQVTITDVDSFFANGLPFSDTLLSAAGVTEGMVTNTYLHNYYRAQEITPLASVTFTDATFAHPASSTHHAERLVNAGVAAFDAASLNVYPNPVTGNTINVELPSVNGKWSYRLTDMTGRNIASESFAPAGTKATIMLPSSLAPGIYNLQVCKDGMPFSGRKVEIIE